jgi:predicted ATPase
MQLLERAEPLEILNRCLQEAASGHGALVFVGGEAGIGKTSLIDQFALEARSTATVATGRCDDLAMPGPFGPFIEIAGQLGLNVERLFGEAMPRDQLSRAFLAALERQKGVIVLVCEDAHWADEASLDLIRYLGRRVSHLPLLVIVTYRDDEIGPYHPFRRILGDLATMPAVRRISLSPLSVDAVAALAIESELDATNLHELTGGNPFFVNEVVAAGRADVPPTVRDAVLARAARLSDEARAVLDAAAAIGMVIDIDLLESVIGGPVEDALDECLAAGVMKSTDGSLAFRHAITRQAILETISLPRYLALQRRILAALQRPAVLRHDLPRIAHHAEEARDRDAVLTAAPAAARQAGTYTTTIVARISGSDAEW